MLPYVHMGMFPRVGYDDERAQSKAITLLIVILPHLSQKVYASTDHL